VVPIRYRSLHGYKYQLMKDYTYHLPEGSFGDRRGADLKVGTWILLKLDTRDLHISTGYCWDGPSGPTIDTRNFMRGSLVHDALYQLFREYESYREYRDEADNILRAICLEDGMSSIRAWWVWMGVKTFGRRAAGG
jgi:Protein of unknown function (DUF1353)